MIVDNQGERSLCLAGELESRAPRHLSRPSCFRTTLLAGSSALRPVRAERAAPGAFSIEWFTRRWVNRTGSRARTFTTYLPRGKGDRYARSTLRGVAQPWELAIAEALEDRFAEIRRTARSVSRVRVGFRQHAKLERSKAEGSGQGNHTP